MISVAVYSLVDKIAVSRMNPVIFAYLFPWVTMVMFTGYLFKSKPAGALKSEWAAHKKSIVACGFLSIFGYFLILMAFTMERMGYVVGLRQLSIVFAVLLGSRFLQEANRGIRLVSSVVIFAGIFMIAMAD
jgi:drug/metabolite transporter (DMT)-like permease